MHKHIIIFILFEIMFFAFVIGIADTNYIAISAIIIFCTSLTTMLYVYLTKPPFPEFKPPFPECKDCMYTCDYITSGCKRERRNP